MEALPSLNGIRQVKDTALAEDGKIHMDFHKKLMSCTRRTNERYRDWTKERNEKKHRRMKRPGEKAEKQKQRVEEGAFQEKKRKLRQTEKYLQNEQEKHQFKLKTAEALLNEAN